MSLGNNPDRTGASRTEESLHAVAAVSEARGELLIDGPAPSKEAILEQMGRDKRGKPIPEAETLPASEAARAARELLNHNGKEK